MGLRDLERIFFLTGEARRRRVLDRICGMGFPAGVTSFGNCPEEAAPTGLMKVAARGTTDRPLLWSFPPSRNVSALFIRRHSLMEMGNALVRHYPYLEFAIYLAPSGNFWIALSGQNYFGLLPWAMPTATMAQAYGLTFK